MSHVLVQHGEYFADGYMQGKLYEINGYPGAIESDNPADKVYGELYRIIVRDFVLLQLDEYEECTDKYPVPHEYNRKKLPIFLANEDSVIAWVYVFNHNVANFMEIESGDYVNYLDLSLI